MIELKDIKFDNSDTLINFKLENQVTYLNKEDSQIFDILSFNSPRIYQGDIIVNEEKLGIYDDDKTYLFYLKLNEKNVVINVVFELEYNLKDKTISNFKKALKEIKNQYKDKNYDFRKKINDIFRVLNSTKEIKYILIDLNAKSNNKYKDVFDMILKRRKTLITIFKAYEGKEEAVEPTTTTEETKPEDKKQNKTLLSIKKFLKDNYIYLIFFGLFSLFLGFASLGSIYLIRDADSSTGLGIFLLIIAILFIVLNISIEDLFYSHAKNNNQNESKLFVLYTILIQICVAAVGIVLGVCLILILSACDVFIKLNEFVVTDYIYFIILTILNISLVLLGKPINVVIKFINKYFHKFLDNFKS